MAHDRASASRTTAAHPPASHHARARQVELILERGDAIPTLSPIAARVLKLGSANDVEIDQLSRVIETDPALATRILGMCRRSDKGLGDKITSVKRAVVMLGLEAVRSAILAVSVYDMLAKDEDIQRTDRSLAGDSTGSGGFSRTGFWKHSVAVACAGELIAADHRQLRVLPEEAFLAGLLHGIGRIVLSSMLPRAYDAVQRLAERAVGVGVERAQLHWITLLDLGGGEGHGQHPGGVQVRRGIVEPGRAGAQGQQGQAHHRLHRRPSTGSTGRPEMAPRSE